MKFENTEVFNIHGALRGMRNPMDSWDKSDSYWSNGNFIIGQNDLKLATSLIKAGSEHRKFLRQIFVSVDITAPLYWWKEFDTYKVGTVANSTSTMHKITSKPIDIGCFEIDDWSPITNIISYPSKINDCKITITNKYNPITQCLIPYLETLRVKYLETKDKKIWKELIRWLPESWLQTRTVTLNYENIFSICKQRKSHKLNEWSGFDNKDKPNFISWARTLPYSKEFLFLNEE